MNRRLGVAALAASIGLLAVPAARASAVSLSELHSLAAQAAAGNTSALAELRSVDSVSGRPVSLGPALSDASPAELRARLMVLATPAPGQAPSPLGAQRAAASILAESRFGGVPVAQPLSPAQSFLDRLAAAVPGGALVFWAVLAALVLAAAALGSRRMLRRLGSPGNPYPTTGPAGTESDPQSLERAAAAAESAGAFGEAVRLRFRAGLISLGLRAAIEYRPSLPTREVSRRLRSPRFDQLTRTFERVAYGGAVADASDAAAAREGWSEVLATLPGRSR